MSGRRGKVGTNSYRFLADRHGRNAGGAAHSCPGAARFSEFHAGFGPGSNGGRAALDSYRNFTECCCGRVVGGVAPSQASRTLVIDGFQPNSGEANVPDIEARILAQWHCRDAGVISSSSQARSKFFHLQPDIDDS